MMCRVYDKTEELALSGREEKRLVETSAWRARGWGEGERVVRVEFQLRGEILDQIDLRDPNAIAGRIDSVWRYCTFRWLRLVILDSASRPCNCATDPRWEVVQQVVFVHATTDAAVRRRKRGGPSTEQTLGTVRSYLASSGELRSLPMAVTADGEVLDERADDDALSDEDAVDLVRHTIQKLTQDAAATMASDLLRAHGPHGAAARLMSAHNGTVARFATVDGREARS